MRILVLSWLLVLLCRPAAAQVDTDPDGIGLYFDEAATVNAVEAAPYATVHAYLIATHPSREGDIAYWEAALRGGPADNMIHGTARGGGYNSWVDMPVADGCTFAVHYIAEPLPRRDIVILADIDIVLHDEVGAYPLRICGLATAEPRYRTVAVDDPLHDLHPSSGSAASPVAVINGAAPVAASRVTWSGVKVLFR